MPSLFARVRQRRVFQIVVSVAAAGWIALEVLNSLIERGILPDPLYRIALVCYLGGLAASFILGWYHGERGDQKVSRGEVLQLTVVALLTVAWATATGMNALRRGPSVTDASEGGLDPRSIAVLYFQDLSGFGEFQYVADGLTESLIDQLGQVRGLDVISRNGSEQFRHSELRPDSVARALEAGTLVDGSVELQGEGALRVNVRLLDGASGAEFQRGVFTRSADDVAALREDLANEVSRFLREWLGEEIALRRQRNEATTNAAWVLVQRAQRARKEYDVRIAHDYAHGAIAQLASADSLARAAEAIEPGWPEPTVLRADVAYRKARLLAGDRHEVGGAIAEAVALANRVLEADPNEGRALNIRGSARYFRWLLGLDHDPAERGALFTAARDDLDKATKTEGPALASAYSALSHLYYQVGDIPNVVLAARRAYEEDAFLDVAHDVLWRLFLGSYDLEQFTQATRWCDEGSKRFATSFRFVECQLWMMTTPERAPEPDSAWALLARMNGLTPEPLRPAQSKRGRMIVGGVLGRAGLADSARVVLVSARGDAEVDPLQELVSLEAFMRTLVGDHDTAVQLLQRYVAGNEEHAFQRGETHWWWRELRDHPGFASITARQSH